MRCPSCAVDDSRVVDSRAAEHGAAIRRRRECSSCRHRFTTFERLEEVALTVVKRSGERMPFRPEKIVRGLSSASKGRPIGAADFERLAHEVEESARLEGGEVTSEWVGLAVLDRLRVLDHVAALRFASVYKGFSEVGDFEKEMTLIKRDSIEAVGPR